MSPPGLLVLQEFCFHKAQKEQETKIEWFGVRFEDPLEEVEVTGGVWGEFQPQ